MAELWNEFQARYGNMLLYYDDIQITERIERFVNIDIPVDSLYAHFEDPHLKKKLLNRSYYLAGKSFYNPDFDQASEFDKLLERFIPDHFELFALDSQWDISAGNLETLAEKIATLVLDMYKSSLAQYIDRLHSEGVLVFRHEGIPEEVFLAELRSF